MAQDGIWLGGLLARKPGMLVRVALANKMARIVWALMAWGGVYRAPVAAASRCFNTRYLGTSMPPGGVHHIAYTAPFPPLVGPKHHAASAS